MLAFEYCSFEQMAWVIEKFLPISLHQEQLYQKYFKSYILVKILNFV